MNNPPTDLGIPLLTEVIGAQAPPERVTAAVPASPAPAMPAAPAPAPAVARPAAVPAPTPVAQPAREPLQFPSAPAAAAATPAVKPLHQELLQQVPEAPAAPFPALAPAAAPAQAGSPWRDTSLDELESELRERITRQVLGRIDFVLDHRVRNSLTDIVDQAIDSLAAEIKRGLHETLNDIVARAVAQEISRLQSTKK